MISTEGLLGVFGLPDTSVEKRRKTKMTYPLGGLSIYQPSPHKILVSVVTFQTVKVCMYIVMIGEKVKNRISLETTFKKLHKQLNPNRSPAISVSFMRFRKRGLI